jgi:hypothetical protein
MAQILDLGKLRFNWTGAYTGTTVYSINDVVTYGPNVYVYTAVTSSNNISPTDTSTWAKVIEGFEWRGTYTTNTNYYKNDLVTDGTSTYLVTTAHSTTGTVILPDANTTLFALGQQGLPNQAAKTNYLLSTDGTNTSWIATTHLTKEYIGNSQGQAAVGFENTATLTNSVSVFSGSATDFVQLPLVNLTNAASASTDFISYTADGTNNDGWIDMGITSRTFDATTFGITGPHDGYIFMSAPRGQIFDVLFEKVVGSTGTVTTGAPHGLTVGQKVRVEGTAHLNGVYTISSVPTTTQISFATSVSAYSQVAVSPYGMAYRPFGNGNLVFATDVTGLANNIVFAAGGYGSGTTQMTIVPNQTVNVAITTASTSATTGALTVSGGLGVTGSSWTNGDIHVGGIVYGGDNTTGSWAAANLLTAPAAVFEVQSADNTYGQFALHNKSTSSSVDFIAYPDNGNDNHGWIDMGMTGSTFSAATYGITGPNDGYIFVDAPVGSSGYGNLVLATGNNGTRNQIVFAAGGFASGHQQMTIIPDTAVKINISTPSTSATTGALVVTGGVGITGDVNVAGNITFGGTGTNVSTANLAVNAPLVFTGSGSVVSTSDLGIVTEGKYTVGNIPVATVINKQLTSNVATLTTRVAHNFVAGDSVVVASVDSTYNGTYAIVAAPTSTTFTYAKTNADLVSTSIGQVTYTITNKSLTSNVATLTTSITHAMTIGTVVDVTGVDSTFNGQYTITAVTTNTFSYAKTNTNVVSTSSSGSAVYYTSVSTATVAAATRTRWGAITKHNTDGVWNIVSNISTLPTATVNYSQNTYGNGVDVVYDQVKLGGLTIQGSGTLYGAPYGSLTMQGSITSPAWTTTGIRHVGSSASTLTDTTSSGTVAAAYTNTFASNVTVAASNATTYTDYANSYFGAPTAGTNVTLTNAWSILTAGAVKVGGALTVTGTTTLNGAVNFGQTTGTIAINTNKFTIDASTGNTLVAGTLGVTGNTTLTGTLVGGSASDITINTNKFTVTASSGNTAVGGTLTTTGLITANGGLTIPSGQTFTSNGTLTITGGASFSGTTDVQELREKTVDVTLSSNGGTLDWLAGNIYVIATAPTGAVTLNLINLPTDVSRIMTINVLMTQGTTGYIPSTFQIGGANQTIRWANGISPVGTSSAGKIDIFSFTLQRTSGGAWVVYGVASLNF